LRRRFRRSNFRVQSAGPNRLNHCAMLLLHSPSQLFSAKRHGVGVLFVIRGAPVQDAPVLVHHRIYDWMIRPTIFGLHVEDMFPYFDVRIEARAHCA